MTLLAMIWLAVKVAVAASLAVIVAVVILGAGTAIAAWFLDA